MGLAVAVAALPAMALAAAPPVIESESATNVSATDATVQAAIDPNGSYTGYEFQLYTIDNGEYNFIQNCPFDLPGYNGCEEYVLIPPPGLDASRPQYIPAGSGEQSLSVDLASIGAMLKPGSTYHFRVIAGDTNDDIVAGPVQPFTTPPDAPAIDSESVSGVTANAATLAAKVNPNGLLTTYEFRLEYPDCQNAALDGSGCGSVSEERVGLGEILTGDSEEAVSVDLSALQSDHFYSYWLVASNSAGRTEGPHQVFGTPSQSAPEPAGIGASLSGAGSLPPAYTPPVKPAKKTIKCTKNKKLSHGKCIKKKHRNRRKK